MVQNHTLPGAPEQRIPVPARPASMTLKTKSDPVLADSGADDRDGMDEETESPRQTVSAAVGKVKRKIREEAGAAAEAASAAVAEKFEDTREEIGARGRRLDHYVADRPLESIAIAFLAGFALSRLRR